MGSTGKLSCKWTTYLGLLAAFSCMIQPAGKEFGDAMIL